VHDPVPTDEVAAECHRVACLLSTCFLGRDGALHSGVVNGISPDPSVLQIPKEKGLGPPNNGPKLHPPVRHKP